MRFSDQQRDTTAEMPVHYDAEAFSAQVEEIMAGNDRAGRCFVFHGGTREQRQQALATLTRHTTGNVHQFQMASLLNEQRMQTQNNLRKAFDHAAEERALLYFNSVDPLFSHVHADARDDEADAEPSTVEYFFDRVLAFSGVVVLGLQRKSYVDRISDHAHVVVHLEA